MVDNQDGEDAMIFHPVGNRLHRTLCNNPNFYLLYEDEYTSYRNYERLEFFPTWDAQFSKEFYEEDRGWHLSDYLRWGDRYKVDFDSNCFYVEFLNIGVER